MESSPKAKGRFAAHRFLLACATMTVAALAYPACDLDAQEPTDLDQLVLRGEIWVDPATSQPHTGPVVDLWVNGNLRERGTLVEGRWDGVHEWFHFNGLLATKETYVDGKLNGPSETYFKNGNLSLREIYVDGELHGAYEAYWARGRLAERGRWQAGERCGEWESFGRTVVYPGCS